MNHFGSGISAGLTMLMLLMTPSSIADDQSITIFVNYKKDRHDFVVNIMDTIQSLKVMIKERLGILPEHQLLKYRSPLRSKVLDDDNKTVSYYHIKSLNELSLSLKEKFEIKVAYNGTDYAIAVEATEKVSSLKTKIKKTIKHFENFHLNNITLSCNGNRLKDSQQIKQIYKECIGSGAISVIGVEPSSSRSKHSRS